MSNQSVFASEKLQQLNPEGHNSLIDLFDAACERFADSTAFACLGHNTTYREVEQFSRQFASYLLNEAGLQQGDRVAIQLPNLSQYPIVAWGVLRAGLTIVNTNPLYTERELHHQFNDSGAKALVILSDLLESTAVVVPDTGIELVIVTNVFDLMEPQPLPATDLPNVISLPEAFALGGRSDMPEVPHCMDDIALLQYTGGTTGVAKGAVLTQGNLYASTVMARQMIDLEEPDKEVMLGPMPMYHVYGFTVHVIGVLTSGGMSVLIPDPRDMNSFIQTMKSYPFTAMAGVNTLFAGLLAHPEFDQVDFSSLRGVIAGGAALMSEIADQWYKRTGTEIYEGYGLSETTSALSVNTTTDRVLGTVGKPMPAMEVKVINEQGESLPAGEEGELLVRGAHIMQGYWQRPEATEEAFLDGWFRTGDVGIVQADGYIRIVDRLKDMILVSGFNVYPNEIEDVVTSHPDILECAVVGVKDVKTGEAVKLFAVATNPELTADELVAHCRQSLTAYKVPRHIEFMQDLPKSNVGKILRRELRE